MNYKYNDTLHSFNPLACHLVYKNNKTQSLLRFEDKCLKNFMDYKYRQVASPVL